MAGEEKIMKYLGLPQWGEYLLQGIFIFALLACAAVALSRAGRSPWLAFLLAVPYVQIVALWAFAFSRWPKKDT